MGANTARVTVTTKVGIRTVNRLAKHWTHRFTVTQRDGYADVEFDPDTHCVMGATDSAMSIILTAKGAMSLEEMKPAVEEHLQRMAGKEEVMQFQWTD